MQDDNISTENKLIDKMFVWYESQPWFRAVIQSIPIGGGSADTILAWRGTNINKQRIKELFDNVSEKLSSVEDSKLNKEFLKSDEFFDLLRDCAETATRSSNQQKRKYVADFLAGTIEQGCINDLSQQIVEDLKVIQDFHLQIIIFLPQNLVPYPLSPIDKTASYKIIDLHKLREAVGMDWGMFNKGISDLERFGFINYDSVGTTLSDGDMRVCRPSEYLTIFQNAIK